MALDQIKGLEFTPEQVAHVVENGDMVNLNIQLPINHIFFFLDFGVDGNDYSLTVEMVHEEGRGWICFFDGTGPDDAYCEPGPDGKYVIVW